MDFKYKRKIAQDILDSEAEVLLDEFLVKKAKYKLFYTNNLSMEVRQELLKLHKEDLRKSKLKREMAYQIAHA